MREEDIHNDANLEAAIIKARQPDKLSKIIELLEWQNELLQGLVAAQFESQQREMEVLEKLLGEGGPSVPEETMEAMERMRTGALRDAMGDQS